MKPPLVTRRDLLSRLCASLFCGVSILASKRFSWSLPLAHAASKKRSSSSSRQKKALSHRLSNARMALRRKFPLHRSNGEEKDYPYVANFHKGLPHNDFGEVTPSAYARLLKAIKSDKLTDWEDVPLGGPKPLKNPLGGAGFSLQGPDSAQIRIDPAPRIDSAAGAAELVELYWMALCRDVPFTTFGADSTIAEASSALSQVAAGTWPLDNGISTPKTVFRGKFEPTLPGPYVSQFLLLDVPWGSLVTPHTQSSPFAGDDYMTDWDSFIAVQRGFLPVYRSLDNTPRYIRNGRDLAYYTREDQLTQAFQNAAMILKYGLKIPYDDGHPYAVPTTMIGFATFDSPHILALLNEVALSAIKSCFYLKWKVHRRIRPEALAGRIHQHKVAGQSFPLASELINDLVLNRIFASTGTYLLSQVYPEGSPGHPSYPSGHSVVAGACATILKLWYNESSPIAAPVVPSEDGLALRSYDGTDRGNMTVGTELDKLAYNIGYSRCWAGIHYRSDIEASLILGEAVAVAMVRQQQKNYKERSSMSFRSFDGSLVKI